MGVQSNFKQVKTHGFLGPFFVVLLALEIISWNDGLRMCGSGLYPAMPLPPGGVLIPLFMKILGQEHIQRN